MTLDNLGVVLKMTCPQNSCHVSVARIFLSFLQGNTPTGTLLQVQWPTVNGQHFFSFIHMYVLLAFKIWSSSLHVFTFGKFYLSIPHFNPDSTATSCRIYWIVTQRTVKFRFITLLKVIPTVKGAFDFKLHLLKCICIYQINR